MMAGPKTSHAVRLFKRYRLDPNSKFGESILRDIAFASAANVTVIGRSGPVHLGYGERKGHILKFEDEVRSRVKFPESGAKNLWKHQDVEPFVEHLKSGSKGELKPANEAMLPSIALPVINLRHAYDIKPQEFRRIAQFIQTHAVSTIPKDMPKEEKRVYEKAWQMWFNHVNATYNAEYWHLFRGIPGYE